MFKNNKKLIIAGKKEIWLIGILVLLILMVFAIVITVKLIGKDEDITDTPINDSSEDFIYNNNKEVIEDKVIGNVTFTNIECYFDGYRSFLDYTITNNEKRSIILSDYEIIIKDNKKNIIAILVPGANQELKTGETLDTGNVIDIDLSNIASIELKISE